MSLLALLAFTAGALAAQPSAPRPVSAPIRELPWSQLNFLHTTDVHGWHAGHLSGGGLDQSAEKPSGEAQYGADWGDYISFAHHLRKRADKDGSDLIVVDTGDRVEGNGLYDASVPQGVATRSIVSDTHIDLMCIGNHELYKARTSKLEYEQLAPRFGGSYLSSNVDIYDKSKSEFVPLAPRFRKFTTKNQGVTIMAFGFLFNFNMNANNTRVQPVEETIAEKWFQDAIRDKEVDLFVIAGHVAIQDPEFEHIFDAIRSVNWDTPVQFFGGHSHIRDYRKFDSRAVALESGRYMETIGFQSISGISPKHKKSNVSEQAVQDVEIESVRKITFSRMYIDNNLFSYQHHTKLNETTFPTKHGLNVSQQIALSRSELGLDHVYGCAPQDFWMGRAPYPSDSNLFTWLEEQVLPSIKTPSSSPEPRILIVNTGAIRFDIFKGEFTKDSTFIVSPFTSRFRVLRDVPLGIADRVSEVMNKLGQIFAHSDIGDSSDILAAEIPVSEESMLHASSLLQTEARDAEAEHPTYHFAHEGQHVLQSSAVKPALMQGYTTHDADGTEGDDTIHAPIQFYPVPNAIQARLDISKNTTGAGEAATEQVSLIYLDFIEPFVLRAIQFLGGNYTSDQSKPYPDLGDPDGDTATFTEYIASWIHDNWKC